MAPFLTRQLAAAVVLEGVPDRIELIPTGSFRTADKRGEFHLRDPAAVIRRSLDAAPGRQLLVDFGHNVPLKDRGRGDAAGWITDMEVEGSRVMASVEWTPAGAEAIRTKAFRFISPVFFNRPDREVVLLGGAGLVNDPGLPQLRQLASREDDTSMYDIARIAAALGLGEDATAEAVLAAVEALQAPKADQVLASVLKAAGVAELTEQSARQICARLTAAEPDPAAFVPRAAFDDVSRELAALQREAADSEVEAAVSAAIEAGKVTPALETWARQLASRDLSEFKAFVAAAPVVVDASRIAATPPAAQPDELTAEERQVASRMGLSREAMLATRQAETTER